MGLAHGLKSIGVPFVVTRDYQEALKHRVILVYPTITGTSFSHEAIRALAAVPRHGGTLIATQVLGGGLEEVFGYSDVAEALHNQEIRWNRAHPLMERMTDPAEWATKLNGKQDNSVGTYSYGQARGALGSYPDGSVAVTAKDYDRGYAYAIGIDLGALLLKGYNNRTDGFTTSFDNRFDPTLDVWLRLLKRMYQTGEPNAVTIGTVPFGKSLSVMFTHDVDFTQSMANAVGYAEFERSKGLTGIKRNTFGIITTTFFSTSKECDIWPDWLNLVWNWGVIPLRTLPRLTVFQWGQERSSIPGTGRSSKLARRPMARRFLVNCA